MHSTLSGVVVDLAQARSWGWSRAVARIQRESLYEFAAVTVPKCGDVALCEVVSCGAVASLETVDGTMLALSPGMTFLGAFSSYYVPDEMLAEIPRELADDDTVSLVTPGGVLAVVVGEQETQTQVRVRAFLRNRSSEIVNTTDYARPVSAQALALENDDRNLVLVLTHGADSNAALQAVSRAIASSSETLVGGRLCGAASADCVRTMQASGAVRVSDFSDFGYPCTHMLSSGQATELFFRLYNNLYEDAGREGYIVFEIPDSLQLPQPQCILSDERIAKRIKHVVYATKDLNRAPRTLQELQRSYGLSVSVVLTEEPADSVASRVLGRTKVLSTQAHDTELLAEVLTEEREARAFCGRRATLRLVS